MSAKTEVVAQPVDPWLNLANTAIEKGGDLFNMAQTFLTSTIEKYGTQAVDTVFWVIRIDALSTLIPAIIVFIIGLIGMIYSVKKIMTYGKFNDDHGLSECGDRRTYVLPDGKVVSCNSGKIIDFDRAKVVKWKDPITFHITCAFSVVSMFASSFKVFSVWAWVAVFAPHIWVVHQIVDKVVK